MKLNRLMGLALGLGGTLFSMQVWAGVTEYCERLSAAGSVLPEPEMCFQRGATEVKSQPVTVQPQGGSTSTSYAIEIRASDVVLNHPVDDFPNQTQVGVNTDDILALAFDQNGVVLYGLDNINKNLVTINQTSGATNIIGPLTNLNSGDLLSGLAIAPDGTCYVTSSDFTPQRGLSSLMTLYTCDLSSGTLTVVGSQDTAPYVVGIAASCDGTLYAHENGEDALYTIDPQTAALTLIGPTGVNAEFAQDITYDRFLQRLMGYIYIGQGSNQYGTFNVNTGAFTPQAQDNPLGNFFGASKTICSQTDVIFRDGFDNS